MLERQLHVVALGALERREVRVRERLAQRGRRVAAGAGGADGAQLRAQARRLAGGLLGRAEQIVRSAETIVNRLARDVRGAEDRKLFGAGRALRNDLAKSRPRLLRAGAAAEAAVDAEERHVEERRAGDRGSRVDAHAEVLGRAEKKFRQLDADGSGGLDMIELSRFVGLLGVPASEEHVRRMLESKLRSKLLSGEEPELDFEGFKEFVEPILEEARETEKMVADEEVADARPNGLPAGNFEASSLGFLTLENPARLAIIKLVSKSAFEYVVLVLIGCNCVLMGLEDPVRAENNPEWMATAELIFVRPIAPHARPKTRVACYPCYSRDRACGTLTHGSSAERLIHGRDVLENLRLGPAQGPVYISTVAMEYSGRCCRAD